MASESYVDSLKSKFEAMLQIDEEKLMRPIVGPLSLSKNKEFVAMLERIKRRMSIAIEISDEVSDRQLSNFNMILDQIINAMKNQADLDDDSYQQEKNNFLDIMKSLMDELETIWTPFAACASEHSYLRDNASVVKEKLEEFARDRMDEMSSQIRTRAEDAATSIIESAKEEASKQIRSAKDREDRSMLTAVGISVKEAQKQFMEAQDGIDEQKKIWARLSIGSSVALFATIGIYIWIGIPKEWEWHVVYHSTIKLSILAAIGTATSFFIKMYRAHLYMSEKNKHRIRVANSIEAFVNSANTPEQRDFILSQLVDSVTQFGISGLLSKEEDGIKPKMVIDPIMRNIPAKSSQE